MTLDALQQLARAMRDAKVQSAEFYDERELSLRIVLHESAFLPTKDELLSEVPEEFQTMPSDEALQFASADDGFEPAKPGHKPEADA